MTPNEILQVASTLLNEPPASMRNCWQRACATLTRAALEQQLIAYWTLVSPSIAQSPMRHQLIALPIYADKSIAATARSAWYGLSRAVHHHTYELPPTVAELRSWHSEVSALLAPLSAGRGLQARR